MYEPVSVPVCEPVCIRHLYKEQSVLYLSIAWVLSIIYKEVFRTGSIRFRKYSKQWTRIKQLEVRPLQKRVGTGIVYVWTGVPSVGVRHFYCWSMLRGPCFSFYLCNSFTYSERDLDCRSSSILFLFLRLSMYSDSDWYLDPPKCLINWFSRVHSRLL
jgi:hypothetical protein